MNTHNICFHIEIRKKNPDIPSYQEPFSWTQLFEINNVVS